MAFKMPWPFFSDNRINSCAALIRPPLAPMGQPAAAHHILNTLHFRTSSLNARVRADKAQCWISWTTSSSPFQRPPTGIVTILISHSLQPRNVSGLPIPKGSGMRGELE